MGKSRLLEEADAYKGKVVAQAEGDASRFRQIYTEYAKAPEVTRQRMYLDTMQQILASSSKVVIDSKGSGNLLYLPLDKLIATTAPQAPGAAQEAAVQQARPQAPTPAADNSPAPPRPDALSGESRTREAMRNRERGDR